MGWAKNANKSGVVAPVTTPRPKRELGRGLESLKTQGGDWARVIQQMGERRDAEDDARIARLIADLPEHKAAILAMDNPTLVYWFDGKMGVYSSRKEEREAWLELHMLAFNEIIRRMGS